MVKLNPVLRAGLTTLRGYSSRCFSYLRDWVEDARQISFRIDAVQLIRAGKLAFRFFTGPWLDDRKMRL